MLLLGLLVVLCVSGECFDDFFLRLFLALGEGNARPSGGAGGDSNDELSEELDFAPSALVGFLPEIDDDEEDCLCGKLYVDTKVGPRALQTELLVNGPPQPCRWMVHEE